MNFNILKEEFVTKSVVKKILASKKELSVEQKQTKDHVSSYKKLTPAKTAKLLKELTDLNISKLKNEICIKIVDILPKNLNELKNTLSMSIIPFNDEEIEKVYELVKPYL